MHEGQLLVNLGIPIALIVGGGFFFYLSIKNKDTIRNINEINGLKILDTSYEWLYFTSFIGLAAIGIHLLVELGFHWYDVTPIDNFTHAISGMAITAIVLNFNLTSKRKFYYPIAIGAAWIAFVSWEVFEAAYVHLNPGGIIQINDWDTAVDLWIDFLGGLAICFLCDELTEWPDKKSNSEPIKR